MDEIHICRPFAAAQFHIALNRSTWEHITGRSLSLFMYRHAGSWVEDLNNTELICILWPFIHLFYSISTVAMETIFLFLSSVLMVCVAGKCPNYSCTYTHVRAHVHYSCTYTHVHTHVHTAIIASGLCEAVCEVCLLCMLENETHSPLLTHHTLQSWVQTVTLTLILDQTWRQRRLIIISVFFSCSDWKHFSRLPPLSRCRREPPPGWVLNTHQVPPLNTDPTQTPDDIILTDDRDCNREKIYILRRNVNTLVLTLCIC